MRQNDLTQKKPKKSFISLIFFSAGEAIYEIGVEDNGLMTGLSEEDMISSLDTLREMARRLGATIEVLRDREVQTDDGVRSVAEILVRKVNKNRFYYKQDRFQDCCKNRSLTA